MALLESGLGLSPWDVLHDGVARRTPLSFGTVTIVLSVAIVALARSLGARIGPATALNAVGVGATVELLASVDVVAGLNDQPLGVRLGLLAVGLVLMGPAPASTSAPTSAPDRATP